MKHLSINLKNSLPTLVSTFLLYGGLNHITLRLRVRCCVAALGAGGLYMYIYIYIYIQIRFLSRTYFVERSTQLIEEHEL